MSASVLVSTGRKVKCKFNALEYKILEYVTCKIYRAAKDSISKETRTDLTMFT